MGGSPMQSISADRQKSALMARHRRVVAELTLVTDALLQARRLFMHPWRGIFLRYFNQAGVEAMSSIAVRAAVLGTLIIGYVANVLAADAEMAARILLLVLREFVPMLAAVIVVAKSGVEITGQLAHMRERGEIRGLQLLGISATDLLLGPILYAVGAATVILMLYFEVVAAVGGVMLAGILTDMSPRELTEHMMAQVRLADLWYCLFKSFVFGVAIGAVICHHGLIQKPKPGLELPKVVSAAVMRGLLWLSLVNILFELFTQGIPALGIGTH
jgi:phospholipid/cholesterol/gamma-HCH transport system permease protein